jgi:hypothetical protein
VTLFCLSNNSDIEVIGSLLLVYCVFLPRAVLSIDSLLCADSEGHRPRIIGAPVEQLVGTSSLEAFPGRLSGLQKGLQFSVFCRLLLVA